MYYLLLIFDILFIGTDINKLVSRTYVRARAVYYTLARGANLTSNWARFHLDFAMFIVCEKFS